MDWSASLSLSTSHERQHRANYGSFSSSSSSAPLKRHGSGSTISIPESIPEHQCVVQFESPRLQYGEIQVLERYDVYGPSSSFSSSSYGSTQTLTITEKPTESTRLQTFKMLLTSSSASSSAKLNESFAATTVDLTSSLSTSCSTSSSAVASSYWLQERERMRMQRERRHLVRNGSPSKASKLRDDDDPETSQYRTAVIMCSVPLLLVVVFVAFVLVFGDGTVAVEATEAAAVLSAGSPQLSPQTTNLRFVPAPPAVITAAATDKEISNP
jgi:hypothetical protein